MVAKIQSYREFLESKEAALIKRFIDLPDDAPVSEHDELLEEIAVVQMALMIEVNS